MLKLIKCEFWKLKRKRLLYALMSLSLFFPLILAYMAKAGTGADTTEHYLQTRFDYVYTMSCPTNRVIYSNLFLFAP